jgi:hypothetical protein
VLALCALGCANEAPHSTTVLAKVPERIVILPLNVTSPMPGALEQASPAAWSALEVYLRAHGASLKTLAAPVARNLWLASVKETRADPKRKNPGFDDAARVLVAKLRNETEFDALIVPTLYVQRAALSGGRARWDGAEHALELETREGAVALPDGAPVEGAIPAASLHAVVFAADGAKLHEGRSGIAVLSRARSAPSAPNDPPAFTLVPRRDPLGDREFLIEGTARALAPFIPVLPPRDLHALAAKIPASDAPAD